MLTVLLGREDLLLDSRAEKFGVVVAWAVDAGAHRPAVKRALVRCAGDGKQALRRRTRVQPLVERAVVDDDGLAMVDARERS